MYRKPRYSYIHRDKLEEAMRELRAENESHRGALQAALLALEAMTVALVPPVRVEEAQGHLEDALVVIREELDV